MLLILAHLRQRFDADSYYVNGYCLSITGIVRDRQSGFDRKLKLGTNYFVSLSQTMTSFPIMEFKRSEISEIQGKQENLRQCFVLWRYGNRMYNLHTRHRLSLWFILSNCSIIVYFMTFARCWVLSQSAVTKWELSRHIHAYSLRLSVLLSKYCTTCTRSVLPSKQVFLKRDLLFILQKHVVKNL